MTGRGRSSRFQHDVVIVGGCGRVGLPLAIALADRGAKVAVYDTDAPAIGKVSAGRLPFHEPAAKLPLRRAVTAGRLMASDEPAVIGSAENVIVASTSAEDEADLTPESVGASLGEWTEQFRDGQALILRSTVTPGTTAAAEKFVTGLGVDVDVAFCPDRITEGMAMTELYELPQIVASRTASGLERASKLFSMLTPIIVPMTPEEAELAKLFTNAWRYIKFAAANQFYMIASDLGLDYERIRQGLMRDYPRADGLAAAGLTAGPCLLKDTIGLARASAACTLGRSAIMVNQGLPGYLVSRLELRFDLSQTTVGILGMAFKAGSDDTRASLSYLLADLLAAKCRAVLCTDPLVTVDPDLQPLPTVLAQADVLVIAAPHPQYADIATNKPVIDIWNLMRNGVLV